MVIYQYPGMKIAFYTLAFSEDCCYECAFGVLGMARLVASATVRITQDAMLLFPCLSALLQAAALEEKKRRDAEAAQEQAERHVSGSLSRFFLLLGFYYPGLPCIVSLWSSKGSLKLRDGRAGEQSPAQLGKLMGSDLALVVPLLNSELALPQQLLCSFT